MIKAREIEWTFRSGSVFTSVEKLDSLESAITYIKERTKE